MPSLYLDLVVPSVTEMLALLVRDNIVIIILLLIALLAAAVFIVNFVVLNKNTTTLSDKENKTPKDEE